MAHMSARTTEENILRRPNTMFVKGDSPADRPTQFPVTAFLFPPHITVLALSQSLELILISYSKDFKSPTQTSQALHQAISAANGAPSKS